MIQTLKDSIFTIMWNRLLQLLQSVLGSPCSFDGKEQFGKHLVETEEKGGVFLL